MQNSTRLYLDNSRTSGMKISLAAGSSPHHPFSFQSVTDRFLKELKPLREGSKITKEEEARLESMLQGLKHVQLKASPFQTEQPHECQHCDLGVATGGIRGGSRVYDGLFPSLRECSRSKAEDRLRGDTHTFDAPCWEDSEG